ncbi:hypothetical protein NY537_02770 [Curtobacterium flaccumfaciens pv. betae]|jgi:hypothetical protein|uniref:hypothetical protein n=1 Tax=Curtobacterium flaccumfaciens TaxID=2035 RepID=UPI0026585500|nr:hypothetical protein [Curtobacterium flaccumfaciens]MCS5511666.1 hypothetical protein [Curtobacterium flaccumfaciens pv. betae]
MEWTPMDADPAVFETLIDGVPAWIYAPLKRWAAALIDTGSGVSVLEDFDVATRSNSPIAWVLDERGFNRFWADLDDATILRLVDYLVYRWRGNAAVVKRLATLLNEGGSAWTVGIRGAFTGLQRRVNEAVAEAAERAMASGSSGARLAEAWNQAFGLQPNPSVAYSIAIKAVEEAAIPVVQPKHGKATLGTVIGQMKGDGDWGLPFDGSSGSTVLSLCAELWNGQTDRHGSNGSAPPTAEAAEAAVIMAVSLVQWFTSGAIARRSSPTT